MNIFQLAAPFYDLLMGVLGQKTMLKRFIEGLSFQEGEILLDVGGGTGRLLELLPPYLHVVVLDSSWRMLERVKTRRTSFLSCQSIEGVAEDLPFLEDSFDYVLCADSLHHFHNVQGSIEEMVRVLHGDGTLRILEFNPLHFFTLCIAFFERRVGEPAHFYRPEELMELLRGEGCWVESSPLNKYQYVVEATKSK